jgi:acyl carrier protein
MTPTAARIIALAERLAGIPATPESRLVEDLALDSLDRVQLAIDVEKEFDIIIPDRDVDDPALGVLSGLIAYVERRTARVGELTK